MTKKHIGLKLSKEVDDFIFRAMENFRMVDSTTMDRPRCIIFEANRGHLTSQEKNNPEITIISHLKISGTWHQAVPKIK